MSTAVAPVVAPLIHLRAVGSATGYKVRKPPTWSALLTLAQKLVLRNVTAAYVFDRQGDRILDLDVIETGETVYVGPSSEWRRPRGEAAALRLAGGINGGSVTSLAARHLHLGMARKRNAAAVAEAGLGANASASAVAAPTALGKALLPPELLATPHLLPDETPARLCAGRPPWGLMGDHTQLGSDANFTRLRGAARQQALMQLCDRFAERLQRRSRESLGAPPPPFPHGASCAVVGSGGSLGRSGSGAAIDAHDVVVRFNLAPAAGVLAAHVGAKTTVRILTDKSYVAFLRAGAAAFNQSRSRGKAVVGGRKSEPRAALLLYCMAQGWVGKCWHDHRTGHVNPVFVRQLRHHLDQHHGRGRLPSAGLLGMAMALSRCGRVSLFGFGNASDANGTDECGHYWECSRQQRQYFGGKAGYHDWNAQWRLVSTWLGGAVAGLTFHDARLDAAARGA